MIHHTRISEVSQDDNGIIKVEFNDKIQMRSSDLDELYEICKNLMHDEKALFLNIFPENIEGSLEFAKESASHEINKLRKAQAIVVKNIPQRIQSTFYKNFFNLGYPFKIFNLESKAVNWLLSLDIHETSISNILMLDTDVIKITTKRGAIINEKGLIESLEIYKRLVPNGGYFISVFSESNTADRTAKLPFESSERVQLKKAEAFVVENLANRIELEYYINKTKQMYPTMVFEDEETALDWINEIRSKEN